MTNTIIESLPTLNSKGFVIHPLKGKRPLIKGWQHLTVTPADIDKYANNGCNIGLVCGKASNVTAIDFDSMLFAYDIFQGEHPNTLKSSRITSRGHVYFKYNPNLPASKHHLLGVEIMSDGTINTS